MRLGGLRDKCAEHTDCRGMLPQKSFKIYVLSGGTSIWNTRKTTLHCFANTKTLKLYNVQEPLDHEITQHQTINKVSP